MKTIQTTLALSILAMIILTVGAGRALAYGHDNSGWYDEHHNRHDFTQHNGHRGYWDHDKSGAKIFISI